MRIGHGSSLDVTGLVLSKEVARSSVSSMRIGHGHSTDMMGLGLCKQATRSSDEKRPGQGQVQTRSRESTRVSDQARLDREGLTERSRHLENGFQCPKGLLEGPGRGGLFRFDG
jgi:hypothetical protein